MNLKNIFSRSNRILLGELVKTDFKLRYQGSFLGYMWSVLKPLLLFAILYIVFDKFLRLGRDIEHFPVYLLAGVILWSFFLEATSQGLASITKRGALLRKIDFPKYIIVVSGTVSSLINLAINLMVLLVFVILNGVALHLSSLLVFLFIAELYVFALAIAFLLSALNVKFRDIGHLWDIFMQALFYATPIIYPVQMIMNQSELVAKILLVNPVAQIVQDARYWLVTKDAVRIWEFDEQWIVIIPFIIVLTVSVIAVMYFKHSQKYFAELV